LSVLCPGVVDAVRRLVVQYTPTFAVLGPLLDRQGHQCCRAQAGLGWDESKTNAVDPIEDKNSRTDSNNYNSTGGIDREFGGLRLIGDWRLVVEST